MRLAGKSIPPSPKRIRTLYCLRARAGIWIHPLGTLTFYRAPQVSVHSHFRTRKSSVSFCLHLYVADRCRGATYSPSARELRGCGPNEDGSTKKNLEETQPRGKKTRAQVVEEILRK